MKNGSSIIPTLKYKNAAAAVDWLCHAFGFTKNVVYSDDQGGIEHAQLIKGTGMIMLSSEKDTPYGRLISVPRDIDKVNTQSPYVVIPAEEIKGHYDNAKKAGAEIAIEYEEQEYGGSSYSAFDPEGHLWNFGSYDPWATKED